MLVVVSKVKSLAKSANLRVSMEFLEALSKLVLKVVAASAQACKESEMATIKARHFTVPDGIRDEIVEE
jgi:hypothetical protein